MAQAAYTRYRTGRFNGRRFPGALLVKRISTLVMLAALGVVIYAAGSFGYGYLQAGAGQGELRSLFSVSGNGSTDPGYLRREAEALDKRLNHLDPVGELYIPGIDSRWMIVQGSDDSALKKGPGHIEETALPGSGGNFAVAGDRVLYGAPFLNLDEINTGDLIKVKMPYATFIYRVRDTFITTPDDVSVLEPAGYEAITLITCDPPWDIKRRIVVRGELETVMPAGTEI